MTSNWKIKATLKSTSIKKRHQEIIRSLLKSRGLSTKKSQDDFFNPTPPKDLKLASVGLKKSELDKAVKRIKRAKKLKQLVYIYGDYDADGVTATTIVWETLYRLGINVMPYIPTRTDKTRGLSKQGIDEIIKSAKTKPDLIITVDNGITSFKACNYAKKNQIDIIITDHHQPQKNKLPQAKAIIHTTDLAGAGVAWILSYFLDKQAINSLDVAALGTIADMVPLLNANRSIAQHGLKSLRQTKRPGIQALAHLAKITLPDLKAYQIGYILSPRLNAMARLEHALDSVRLLCTNDQTRANQIASTLEATNQNRQNLTYDMISHAEKLVDKSKKIIFIADNSYHEGIVGLVAGRLMEKFYRPAIVVAIGKNHSKGSARSIEKFDAIKSFRTIEKDLINLGGHKLAAGFTCETKDLDKIQKKLEALADKKLKAADLVSTLDIDCEIKLKDITQEFYSKLEKFKPFGMKNPDPVFATKQVKLTQFRAVGQKQTHLKLELQGDSLKFGAIAFNQGHLASKLSVDQSLDIAYTIDENTWNDTTTLQLKIKDIQTTKPII